jgi:hypothetical protein
MSRRLGKVRQYPEPCISGRTIDRRKPEDNPVQHLGSHRTYHTQDTQNQYRQQNGLQRGPASHSSADTKPENTPVDIRRVRVTPIDKIRVHARARKKHLADCIRDTRDPGCLAEEITPALDPGENRDLRFGDNVLGDKVHAAGSGIGGHQLCNGAAYAHGHA